MVSLPMNLRASALGRDRTIHLQVDRSRFERVAALLGLYHPDFLKSLARAERDVRAGRTKQLRSLADLRRNA